MVAALKDLEGLPDWPRWLSEEQAAAYQGVSINQFRAEVEAGLWPQPQNRGRRLTYDRKLLDAASDRRSGIAAEQAETSAEQMALACISRG